MLIFQKNFWGSAPDPAQARHARRHPQTPSHLTLKIKIKKKFRFPPPPLAKILAAPMIATCEMICDCEL